jgi:hypothetical protein
MDIPNSVRDSHKIHLGEGKTFQFIIISDQNRPSTSTGEYTALERETTTGMGRTDRHQKKTADKSHSNPLEEAEKRGNGTDGNGTKRKTRTSRVS